MSGVAGRGREGYKWVRFDLETSESTVLPLDAASQALLDRRSLALYGTNTRDDLGNAYLVGRYIEDGVKRPLLLQARFGG